MQKKFFQGLVVAMLLTCANGFAQDWKAFCLNGSVKSVQCTDNEIDDGPVPYSTLTFNSAGKVSKVDDVPLPMSGDASMYHATRNTKGQLSSYVMDGMNGSESTRYTYNAQGRIATSQSFYNGKADGKAQTHTYDTNGNLIKRGTTTYTILKKDSQGNWLSRKYKDDDGEMVTETRTITYWNTSTQSSSNSGAFVSSDLKMNDLRGKVKSISGYYDETDQSNVYKFSFSQSGTWTYIGTQTLKQFYNGAVQRNAKGQIIRLYSEDMDMVEDIKYTYNTQGFVSKRSLDYGMDGSSIETFTYDANGDVVKKVSTEGSNKTTENYTILARDSKGNWTRRKVVSSDGSRVEKRSITYWQ